MRVLRPPVYRSGPLTSYWKCEVSKRAALNYLATGVRPEGCIQSGGGLLHQTCAKLLYGILQIPTRRPCGRDGPLVVAGFVVCSVQFANRYSIINPVQRLTRRTGTLTLRNKDAPPLSTCSRRTMPRPMQMAQTSPSKSHKWLSRPQCNDVRDLTSHGALSLSVSISRALSLSLSISLIDVPCCNGLDLALWKHVSIPQAASFPNTPVLNCNHSLPSQELCSFMPCICHHDLSMWGYETCHNPTTHLQPIHAHCHVLDGINHSPVHGLPAAHSPD